MAEQKHYTRAPITEAIIDVRVELSADVTLDTLAEARAVLPDYPTSTNIEFFQTHVSVAPELTDMMEFDDVFPMPPKRHYSVELEITSVRRPAPQFVDDAWGEEDIVL